MRRDLEEMIAVPREEQSEVPVGLREKCEAARLNQVNDYRPDAEGDMRCEPDRNRPDQSPTPMAKCGNKS